MPAEHQALELDLDSLGRVLGPGGLHEFLDQAVIQPVLQAEAGAVARQEAIGAQKNRDAAISPRGLFAIEESFDAFSFHDMVLHEGIENIGEEELIRDLRRKHRSVVVRSRSRQSSIIVPASKYTKVARPPLPTIAAKAGCTLYGPGGGVVVP